MIPGSRQSWQIPDWQNELATAVRDPAELLQRLQLPSDALPGMQLPHQQFKLRVPQSYLSRIRPGDPNDPLLLQVLPQAQEAIAAAGYVPDPVGDLDAMPVPGLLHKYHGRVLLITTGACAIHCRYCFRRHFPYQESQLNPAQWQAALSYIKQHPDITEVILSGGDPLSLSDQRLAGLLEDIARLKQLKRVRIHTRLPSVIPARVTPELIERLAALPQSVVVVLHINHANEIDEHVAAAVRRLKHIGLTLLNQAVLLRGINDSAEALEALSEAVFEIGILPYYLHLLDPVAGATHFDVDAATASALIDALRQRLPGYLVPGLVKEIPGHPHKLPI